MAGQILVRTILPVAADRTVGDPRVEGGDHGITDAEFVHDPRPETFDDHIGGASKAFEDVDAFRLL